jgi:hypothetical protein
LGPKSISLYLHSGVLHLLKQVWHRGSHLISQSRISGEERVAADDVLRKLRIRSLENNVKS